MTNKVKLAEALLRRKELMGKVQLCQAIKTKDLFDLKVNRVKVADGIDEVTANVPKLELNQVTAEYDYYAGQLRRIDAAIQQANWTSEIEVDPNAMVEFADWHRKKS